MRRKVNHPFRTNRNICSKKQKRRRTVFPSGGAGMIFLRDGALQHFTVLVVRHKFAAAHAFCHALSLHHVGERFLYLCRVLHPGDIELRRGLIRRATMDGAKAEHTLPQRAAQRHVHNAVQAHLILLRVQHAGVDEQLFFCQRIFRKSPWQAECDAFSVAPNDAAVVCVFHSQSPLLVLLYQAGAAKSTKAENLCRTFCLPPKETARFNWCFPEPASQRDWRTARSLVFMRASGTANNCRGSFFKGFFYQPGVFCVSTMILQFCEAFGNAFVIPVVFLFIFLVESLP